MKKILVAVDFSRNTIEVVTHAFELAQGLDGKLWIIHVTADEKLDFIAEDASQLLDFDPEFISAPVDTVEMARDLCAEEYHREHQAMLKLSAKMNHYGIEATSMLLKGETAEIILKKAEDLEIDLIVMGAFGNRLGHEALIGTVTEEVLSKTKCGVLIIPPPQQDS